MRPVERTFWRALALNFVFVTVSLSCMQGCTPYISEPTENQPFWYDDIPLHVKWQYINAGTYEANVKINSLIFPDSGYYSFSVSTNRSYEWFIGNFPILGSLNNAVAVTSHDFEAPTPINGVHLVPGVRQLGVRVYALKSMVADVPFAEFQLTLDRARNLFEYRGKSSDDFNSGSIDAVYGACNNVTAHPEQHLPLGAGSGIPVLDPAQDITNLQWRLLSHKVLNMPTSECMLGPLGLFELLHDTCMNDSNHVCKNPGVQFCIYYPDGSCTFPDAVYYWIDNCVSGSNNDQYLTDLRNNSNNLDEAFLIATPYPTAVHLPYGHEMGRVASIQEPDPTKTDKEKSIYFKNVAGHELGHIFGLNHPEIYMSGYGQPWELWKNAMEMCLPDGRPHVNIMCESAAPYSDQQEFNSSVVDNWIWGENNVSNWPQYVNQCDVIRAFVDISNSRGLNGTYVIPKPLTPPYDRVEKIFLQTSTSAPNYRDYNARPVGSAPPLAAAARPAPQPGNQNSLDWKAINCGINEPRYQLAQAAFDDTVAHVKAPTFTGETIADRIAVRSLALSRNQPSELAAAALSIWDRSKSNKSRSLASVSTTLARAAGEQASAEMLSEMLECLDADSRINAQIALFDVLKRGPQLDKVTLANRISAILARSDIGNFEKSLLVSLQKLIGGP